MKKIDLHIHTQKCKSGDGSGRNITPEDFVQKMTNNNIAVCSITNHNKFDLEEYNKIIQLEESLVIFPGIELDVMFHDEVRHIILICDPAKKNEFSLAFSNDMHRDYDDYKLIYDDFIEKIKKFTKKEIMILPHFLDKDKKRAITRIEKDQLKSDLEDYIIILEPSKLQTMGIINAHNEISLVGSDIKKWSNYDEEAKKLPELKFAISSYGKFYELAADSTTFIKTALDGCTKYDIELLKNLTIFEDVNVIFGEKGSGKTKLLKDYVHSGLQKYGKKIVFHEGKNYQETYNDLIEGAKNKIQINQDVKKNICNAFDKALDYSEKPCRNFILENRQYLENNITNKRAMKIKKAETVYMKSVEENIEEFISIAKSEIKSIDTVQKINYKYNKSSHEELNGLLSELKLKIVEKNMELFKRKFVFDKTNSVLSGIKEILKKKTGMQPKPNNIGFIKLIQKRRSFVENIFFVKSNLKDLEVKEKIKLGNLPQKGNVFAEIGIEVLKSDFTFTAGSIFTRNNISSNRTFIGKFQNFSIEDFKNINEYFSKEEKEYSGKYYFEEIVRISSKVVRETGEIYIPSEGEKSILSITGVIENYNYDFYLFDELERGVGHKYISDYIIPKIKFLRDRGKTIVLSTHDANIAISTLPSQTIYCNYKGEIGDEDYFSGNMYSNSLKSLQNEAKTVIWEEVALEHLEGSKEMFELRSNIWELNK